jgi:hypothetical protein
MCEGRGRIMEGDEPNQGKIYVFIEMSQGNPLYNYHILIKIF